MVTERIDYAAHAAVHRVLQERPEWRERLREMVAYEEAHERDLYYIGWEWQSVHTPPSMINMMIAAGIVDLESKSRSSAYYRLADRAATSDALTDAIDVDPVDEPVDVDSLFRLVVGHERVKTLIRYALQATGAVHCLLIGQPGTAKTLILSDIGRLPGAQFYLGSTTTRSGLIGLLLAERPTYLCLDEIDKMDERDMSPLLSLMETGMVTRLLHGHRERVTLPTRVFAGANDATKLSSPILNRFAKFEIPPYTPGEFIEVARNVLRTREGLGPEMGLHIAAEVVKHSLDIRDAVRVARMARGNPERVREIVNCLWPGGRGDRPTPIGRRAT